MQGAAFDLPEELAEEIMEKKEELTSRGFSIDLPTSLPIESVQVGRFDDGGGRGRYGGGRGGRGGRQRSTSFPSSFRFAPRMQNKYDIEDLICKLQLL